MNTTSAFSILAAKTLMARPHEIPDEVWALLERYRGELLNQALAITGSLADAEDIVQETFLEAYKQPQQLAGARSLGSMLRAINRANALNHLRGQGRESNKARRKQALVPSRTVTTGGFSLLEMRDAVAKGIEKLPARLRTVVALRYWEGLGYEEIAARLQIPAGTVGRLLFEATEALYTELGYLLEAPAQPSDPNATAPLPYGRGSELNSPSTKEPPR